MDVKLLTKLKKKAIRKFKICALDENYFTVMRRGFLGDWTPLVFHSYPNLEDVTQDLISVRRKYVCNHIKKLKFHKTKKNTEQQIKIINSNW